MNYPPTLYPFQYKAIDYAGLFPPASLTLDDAIKNYAKYRSESENWMLSRFVIPGSKLNDLVSYRNLFTIDPPFSFSIIGGVSNSTNEFKRELDSLFMQISNFENAVGKELVSIKSLELKIPVLQDILFVLNIIADSINNYNTDKGLEIYLEFNLTQNHSEELKLILRHIKEYNLNNKNEKIKFVGYKVRTGGLEAKNFPTVDRLASIILECNNFGVQLKATAGLHHPIRHYDISVQTHMYGFINVIAATILTSLHKLDFNTIYDILQDEDSLNFKFTDQKFSWGKYEATKEQIEFSRKSFISFGSCSFEDPIDDLTSLGLLHN